MEAVVSFNLNVGYGRKLGLREAVPFMYVEGEAMANARHIDSLFEVKQQSYGMWTTTVQAWTKMAMESSLEVSFDQLEKMLVFFGVDPLTSALQTSLVETATREAFAEIFKRGAKLDLEREEQRISLTQEYRERSFKLDLTALSPSTIVEPFKPTEAA